MTKQITLPGRMALIAAAVALTFSAALASQGSGTAEAKVLPPIEPLGSIWL